MKSLIIKLSVGVVLALALSLFAGFRWYLYRQVTQPTLEKNGGTILVYEIDVRELPENYQPEMMAEAIQRRADPGDYLGLGVRPREKNRFEIAIPRGRRHDEDIQRVKDLLAQVGLLEFRIVANEEDDRPAFQAARDYFENAKADEKRNLELERLAQQGLPPPPPRPPEGEVWRTGYTYTWVEVGKSERKQLGLHNAPSAEPGSSVLWKSVAVARENGEPLVIPASKFLLFSRRCANARLTSAERDNKAFEYFLLTRDPVKDETGTARAIGGADLATVNPGFDQGMQPTVDFRFSPRGGDRFYELTSANLPTGPAKFHRHLAIILDGQIMSAPRLVSAIHTYGQITGSFTQEEVDQLVAILRAGALPAPLKPLPVSETTVEPTR